MATTELSSRFKIITALVAAGVLGGGAAWVAAADSGTAPPASQARSVTEFWPHLAPQASEIKIPQSVEEIVQRSNTIVLAHVTGVTEGRDDKACAEVAPNGGCTIPKTVFVQLTVDRVVHGSVSRGQVLNLEMFRPPAPLGIEGAQENLPPGQLLFFLHGRASDPSVFGITSLSRGVVAQGPQGLYTALAPNESGTEGFLQSFQASTVDGAADRAAQAVR